MKNIPRVIPFLSFTDGAFVKTKRFSDLVYVGDPVNVINLFNKFEVDEIILADIRATLSGAPPQFDLIADLAAECWVPLAYGGGIRDLQDVEKLFRAGVEKVIFNTAFIENPKLIEESAKHFGSQAVVVSLDFKKVGLLKSQHEVFIRSGTQRTKLSPVDAVKRAQSMGAGEVLAHSIDHDGGRLGYDLDVIREIAHATSLPVVACGGAATRDDLPRPVVQAGASAVAAGSLFLFQREREGVLVNFPEREKLESLF